MPDQPTPSDLEERRERVDLDAWTARPDSPDNGAADIVVHRLRPGV